MFSDSLPKLTNDATHDVINDAPNDPVDDPPAVKKTKPNVLPVARMDGRLTLKPHQYAPALAVASYFEKINPVSKGVLVDYDVGTGKTFSALHAARTFIELTGMKGHVYIITTLANTDSTWARDWEEYKSALNEPTPGASATYTRVLEWGTKDTILNMALKSPYMLIIDEAHLLRNMESVNGPKILNICKQAAYVLLLTATPIVRTVKNLNALYSYIMGEDWRIIDSVEDIPSPIQVGKYFAGMVLYQSQDTSRYSSITYSTEEVKLELYPLEDDANKMKELQTKLQNMRHGKERWNTTIARVAALGAEDAIPNPFHVNGRRMCNSELKFQSIWNAIVSDGDNRVVVYSNFRDEGIDGFMEWLLKTQNFRRTGARDYEYIICKEKSIGRTYEVVLWSNKQFEAITRWQHRLDDIFKILLISPMAREGLSLKGVRQFHLMEPSWNISDETQAIGRARRMTSHTHLPPDQQTVHVRRWIATYEEGQTADERLTELAIMRARVSKPYSERLHLIGTWYINRLLERLSIT